MEIKAYKTEKEGGKVILDVNNTLYSGGWQYDGEKIALYALDAETFGKLRENRVEIEKAIKELE